MSPADQLDLFFKHQSHIRYVTPTSPDYPDLRARWYLSPGATPLGIARPRTAEDVATIISFVVPNNIPFRVRGGGHDSWDQGFAAGALTIDLREINFVHIDADKKSAKIGGGVLIGRLAQELEKHKLATSTPSVPSIGYVGWAACGGYGCFSGSYGLGLDQILAAKLVNSEGDIVSADPEMMRIIRGGGGMLGIIVELTIKVYPLEKILSGFIAFESSNLRATIKTFAAEFRALQADGFPAPLHLLPVVTNTPFGKMFGVALVWSSSDYASGRRYIDRVATFGHAIINAVEENSIPDWQEASIARIPREMFGEYNHKSFRVYDFTDEVADVIATAAEKMPNDLSLLTGLHTMRDAQEPIQDSVFKVRRPHFLIEMLPTLSVNDAEKLEEARQWSLEYLDALKRIDPGNVVPGQYITHTSPQDANWQEMYGEHWDAMIAAKKKYDPRNVFRSGAQFSEAVLGKMQ